MSVIGGGSGLPGEPGVALGFPARSDFVRDTVNRFAVANDIDQAAAERVTRFILAKLFVGDDRWEAALTSPEGIENLRQAEEALREGMDALLDPVVMRLVVAGRMRAAFWIARRRQAALLRRCRNAIFPCRP